MTTTLETTEALTQLGFSIESSTPVGAIDSDNWPHILYNTVLSYNGKQVCTGPYRLGVGHVDIKKVRVGTSIQHWSLAEEAMIYAWQRNPGVKFSDPKNQAALAAKLAKQQKVTPQLADVLHSLLLDGEAFFNAQSFEDWASEYGYDVDSRKAESIYRACDATGRKLKANIPQEALDKARELLKDH